MACSVRSAPAPLRALAHGAPLAQTTSHAHLPPPFPLHRPSSVCTRSDNCHLDHVAHKPTDCHHHAQLPTITITLFQPSPTSPIAAHLTPPTAKLLNRGCSKLHQGVAINFVKKEDIRILRDIEQYYSRLMKCQ
ncbi:hypothetical protein GUJ93_ZPchr0009g546 [Zizania palustris]|uniref:Uncharacterized protein n=1 Tax=Zizania palustris TaxID=103762 RepID=A0A8J5RQI7_ZIZPA|nr:hypothetical protein GUJ93_ZPchr0009g546 [Zizania palustris]